MEVVPQTAIRAQNKQVNELSSKGLTRKKSTPYKHCNPLPLRAKTKAPDSKEDDEVRVISEVRSPPEQTTKTSEQNNYGPSLQQQSLFMQWKQNAESSTYEKGGRIRMYETRPPSPKTPSPLDHQVAIRRLRDYKVQELKNECKKRQLPVSGAKPQLLERLRPFEKTILGMSPPPTPEPAQFSNSSAIYGTVGSPTHETQHKEPVQEVAYESVMQAETTAHCQHTLLRSHQQPFEQARNAVGTHDYRETPLVLHLSSQVVQLTDAKGAPVGIASVQYKPGSGHPVLLSCHPRFGPQQGNAQPSASDQHGATSNERVAYTIPIQQGSNPTQAQLEIANVPALNQPRAIQTAQVIQKQNDNTFRFAQMGSGGQFTVAPTIEGTPAKGKPLNLKLAGAKYEEKDPLIMCFIDQQSAQMTRIETNEAALLVAFQPTMTIPQASSQSVAQENRSQSSLVQSEFIEEALDPCLEDSPRTADLAGDSPHMPNSCQSESVAESGDATSKNSITFDDPSSILTPAALSMHEEMLRTQQKKIEKLLEELAKSQAHLKQEQQLILCAKKAQQRVREHQRELAANRERGQWLRELDVGYINKQHIQHFLQHKKQQTTLQRHSIEHSRLTATEARLQEELHVEQAVQDIVRLIKQDPRTALLIVQLLRRYQLERNAEQKQASLSETDKTNTPESVEQEPLEHAYGKPLHHFDKEQNVVEDGRQSVFICDAYSMQLHSDQTVAYHRDGRLTQDGKKQTVDMEAVFESVLEDASRAVGNGSATAQVQLSEMELEGSKQQSDSQPQQIITQTSVENGFTAVHQSAQLMNSSRSYEQQKPVGYSEDIEDLMAVLRDDQDDGLRHGSFQMDLGVGYGSEELADLLGEDWLDCADRSIANNGQYIPYKNESHDGVDGRSTDPKGIPSQSEESVGDQKMDWLDVMLENAPSELRPRRSH